MGGAMSRLVRLTARTVETAKPGEEIRDSQVPGLRLRVSPKGLRRFVLVTHYPGQKNASRRGLTATTLGDARDEALAWVALIRRGVDPHAEQERRRLAELRRQEHSFLAVTEAYFSDCRRRQLRSAALMERDIRKELIPRWADRPIAEITRSDVTSAINEIVNRGVPGRAHGVFALCRGLFSWVIHSGRYGLEHSPCDHMQPSRLIGERKPRQRTLSDDELRAFWGATAKLGYPGGALLRMLLLSGQRRVEVSAARWSEFNFSDKTWTLPPERFKSDSTHVVPLTADLLALLCELPRFAGGDFVFTTNHGTRSLTGFSFLKRELDRVMADELRKIDPAATPAPFVIHDLRRTVRTRLSSLRIPDTVAEMVIGHGRKGLQRVYDQHKFIDEMREALEAWNARLRAIVNPPSANIIVLGAECVS
jgi:integrase